MTEMPEFVTQLEQASGLPWWCLLLIAVMALVIIVLAASLSRAKKRVRAVAVDIPRGAEKAVEASASEVEPDGSNDASADADGAESEDAPSESAAEDEAAPEPEAENPENEDSDALQDEPTEPEAAETEFESESAVAESADDSEAEQAGDTSNDEAVTGPSAEVATPKIEVLEEEHKKSGDALDLNDDEILKATAGSHGRIGQSAFGIDFGFLEEYEAEYEQAFNEFRRLRTDLGGKAPTGPEDRFNEA